MVSVIRGVKIVLAAGGVVVAGAAAWLAVAPPELLRVGTGYAAKIVCSNVFVAKRDPDEVLRVDVQAPGNPLLRLLRLKVDREEGQVTAYMFGLFAPGTAIYRPGLGCASVPDGNVAAARAVQLPQPLPQIAAQSAAPWPQGMGAAETDPKIAAILADPALIGPGMRATLVIRDGKLVGETYGPGFKPETPLIGWSMTKTVTAALVGLRVGQGALSLDKDHLFPAWEKDDRSAIRIRHLMGMESGLEFNEDYGDVSDVTRMLFLEPDQPAFVAAKPLAEKPGTRFYYSTGTTMLLSRLVMDSFPSRDQALMFPQAGLFLPLAMGSAVLEADERGTLSGGSYLYADARDWAKFAQFLLQDGVWEGQRLLPEGFVKTMWTPTASSKGSYTQGQMWKAGPLEDVPGTELPAETVWMRGHDGQTVTIIPSKRLIVLRMGLTPGWLAYKPQALVKAVLDATP
ncbi:serine hydrolase domain-containing protein [Rhizobium paknamense]|uniref:CubicO group peptidase (Beta-lactamase class C family) n=1 Tax=Rhizobium paknamense TaxID=1206817 RepID=A0ABU0IAN3_9HYPH|nr:serine hydrolase [Rhizobium paknamense]MDQ0454777.1 CubicO group peptidase (beta-lactamase class C family) [Rhizobium paknamense]